MRRVPSLERINNTINWEPKTDLTEALRVIIEYEKSKVKNAKP